MEEKYCPRCKQVKPLSDFSLDKHRGRPKAYCKACWAEYGREWRAADPERTKRIQRTSQEKRIATIGIEAYREERRKYREQYYNAHPAAAERRRYGRAKLTPEQRREKREREPGENHEKWLARVAVTQAVRRGSLPPVTSLVCVKCGEQAQHYHHPDYKYRLYVIPVCAACHAKIHGEAQL